MAKPILFIFSFFVLMHFESFSQKAQAGANFAQTVQYINKQLGKEFLVEINEDNDLLTISFFKNGKVYKIDKVYIASLDASKIFYSEEEHAFIVKCRNSDELTGKLKKFADGCFEREIVEKKMIGSYGRMSFEIGNDKKKIENLKKAFIHLINLSQNSEYINNIILE